MKFMNSEKCLTVVMPAYNEEATIVEIVNQVLERPEVGELIIVNDASKDNSYQICHLVLSHLHLLDNLPYQLSWIRVYLVVLVGHLNAYMLD